MKNVIKDFKEMVIDSPIAWAKKHKVAYVTVFVLIPLLMYGALFLCYWIHDRFESQRIKFEDALYKLERMINKEKENQRSREG